MLPSMDGSCRPEAVGLRRRNGLEIRVGCAGWGLPARAASGGPGPQLERYARMLGAVEINTTFYRPRRRETYERWAGSVPPGFRLSGKGPRGVPHGRPPRGAGGAAPGGVSRLAYIRPHGSPRVYYSAYSSAFLESLAARVRALAERAEV